MTNLGKLQTANLDLLQQNALRKPAGPRSSVLSQAPKELADAARDLESIFLNQMLGAMRKTIGNTENPMHGGQAESMFTGMLDEEYAGMASKHGKGFGLAEAIVKQLWNGHTRVPARDAAAYFNAGAPQPAPVIEMEG